MPLRLSFSESAQAQSRPTEFHAEAHAKRRRPVGSRRRRDFMREDEENEGEKDGLENVRLENVRVYCDPRFQRQIR